MENRGGGGGRKLEREVSPDLILDPVKNSFLNSKENCTEPLSKNVHRPPLFLVVATAAVVLLLLLQVVVHVERVPGAVVGAVQVVVVLLVVLVVVVVPVRG